MERYRQWLISDIVSGCQLQEIFGGVAQLGEHLLCKQGVIGSIPFISTSSLERVKVAKMEKRHTKSYGLIAQVVRAHA